VLAGKEYGSGRAVTGGEGHRPARGQGGDRRELRADPPLQPGRHGRHPLQFPAGESIDSLGLDGTEVFSITGIEALEHGAVPKEVTVEATSQDGSSTTSPHGCASTPRWRPSTTRTAASCPTCSASSPAEPTRRAGSGHAWAAVPRSTGRFAHPGWVGRSEGRCGRPGSDARRLGALSDDAQRPRCCDPVAGHTAVQLLQVYWPTPRPSHRGCSRRRRCGSKHRLRVLRGAAHGKGRGAPRTLGGATSIADTWPRRSSPCRGRGSWG